LTPLERLTQQRINGPGMERFGPFDPARYTITELLRNTEEEAADARAYGADFYLLKTGDVEGAAMVAAACEGLWAALEPLRAAARREAAIDRRASASSSPASPAAPAA
jgi:hypothetical protein